MLLNQPAEFVERYNSFAGNDICADCGDEQVEWMIINKGLTVCMRCAGIHRGFGIEISKVRSILWDKPFTRLQWNDFLDQGGNQYINKTIFENNKPIYWISSCIISDSSLPEQLRKLYLKINI